MMMKRMGILLLSGLTLVGLAAAQAAAAQLTYNDSGFNYGTTGVQTAYLGLSYSAGTLTLTLSSSPSSQLPAIDVNNQPQLDSAGAVIAEPGALTAGVSLDAPLDNLENIQTLSITYANLDTGEASDNNTDFQQIVSSYDTALTKLGFKSSVETDMGSTLIKDYSQGGDTFRVIYNRDALLQTSVHISLPGAA